MRWNGIQMWCGAVDWPAFDGGDAMVVAGNAAAKLVLCLIAPGTAPGTAPDRRLTTWVACARTADGATPPPGREHWSRPGRLGAFRHSARRLAELPFVNVATMIAETTEIFECPMCDRDPLPW